MKKGFSIVKAGIILCLLAASVLTLSFAAISVKEYSPGKLNHELNLEGKDESGTYTYREFSYTPDETCRYMFEDKGSLDSGITVISPDGKTVVAEGREAGKGFSLMADLVKGSMYTVIVRDYEMKLNGETVITKVKSLDGNQVIIKNRKNSWSPTHDWGQVFEIDVASEAKSVFMLKLTNGAVKNTDLSRHITMTVYDSSWNKVGEPVKKVLNGSYKPYVIKLDEGRHYVRLDIHIKDVNDAGSLTWDVMEDMGDGSGQTRIVDGYDLLTSSSFTPVMDGSYTFEADNRAVRVSVEKNGSSIAARTGKSVSASLKKGVEYSVYFHTAPSEENEVAISSYLTPPTVEVRNSSSALVKNGGYLKSAAAVSVKGENMTGVKVKLDGKYIKWPDNGRLSKEGRYEVRALYVSGGVYSHFFTIDLKKPTISVRDAGGRYIASGSAVKGGVTLKSSDRNQGAKRMTLDGKPVAWPLSGKLRASGRYVMTSYDKAGNASVYRLTLLK